MVTSFVSHSGAVTALDFNPSQPTLVASGGISGELLIFNLANPHKPTVHQPGTGGSSPSAGAITSVAFHPRHRHILASSSQNGMTVIWDLREKRPAFSFSDPNRSFHCKSIAWNPEQPMHIAAASDDDEAPLVNIWDLHMTIAPKSTLKGHQRGIMGISWCQQDKSLMLSTGKDNRTLCWDINTSSVVSEIGSSAGWNLDVQWSPKNPTMLSTCSLDGKIRIYSVSDFDNLATPQSMQLANSKIQHASPQGISEDDLFNRKSVSSSGAHGGSTNNSANDLMKVSRQLSNGARMPARPPSWLRRPVGASFAFGGRLVTFNAGSKQVTLQHMASNQVLAERANALQAALVSGDIARFCEDKLNSTPLDQPEERQTWSFLQALCQERSPQDEVLAILERDPEVMSQLINDYLRTLPTPPGMLEEKEADKLERKPSSAAIPNGAPKDDLFGSVDDSEFEDFSIPPQSTASPAPNSVGETIVKKASSPLSLQPSSETESHLMNALLISDFEAAVECCVRVGRMADALVIAACGGDKLFKDTQRIFFRQNKDRTYLSVVEALVNRDLTNFVERVELAYWREALVLICSHSSGDENRSLAALLGDRLEKAHQSAASTLCYLCAGAVDNVTSSWLNTMKTQSSAASEPSQRHLLIQELMEKVVIFSTVSRSSSTPDIVLKQYSRYAELLANQGLFEVALRYLSRLNLNPSASAHSQSAGAVASAQLLDRVYHALPLQVAQACYGGPLQSIYTASKRATNTTSTAKSTGSVSRPITQNGHTNNGIHTPANTGFTPASSSGFKPAVTSHGAAVAKPTGAAPVLTPARPGFQGASTFQPISTFQPGPVVPAPGPAHMQTPSGPAGFARGPQHATATFQPIQPSNFGAPTPMNVGPAPIGTFTPSPVESAASTPAGPPKRVVRAPAPSSFTPSAAPAPVAAQTEEEPPKKKKGKKSTAAKKATTSAPVATASTQLGPTPYVGPATGTALPSLFTGASHVAPGPVYTQAQGQGQFPVGNTYPAASGYAASNVVSSVAIPPPKVRTSRVVAPHMTRSPATAPAPGPAGPGPAPGPARFGPPPTVSAMPFQPPTAHMPYQGPGSVAPPAADPATWDPQSPLPPHLLAAAGMGAPAPTHQQHFATPAGYHPPPPTSFMPSQGGHAGPVQTFQPTPTHHGFGHSAPAPAAALPPPKPGRAKKEGVSTASASAPTPVYVTGPQAEALAAPKSHEPTQAEIDLVSTLVSVLNKIVHTGDAAHADLVSRFEDLHTRLTAGQIPDAIVPTLGELATAMAESRYSDAQEKHGEVTQSPHYHAIGSRAMLGLKRMIILIQRYNL